MSLLKLFLSPNHYPPSTICGVDEVGRGPCAGPVVAASVIFPDTILDFAWAADIRDSKKIGTAKRDDLYNCITTHCQYAIGECTVAEIDSINILQASLLAMKRAVEKLSVSPQMIYVDGNKLPKWDYKSEAVIGGDNKILSIAAASIVAKVHRDRLMQNLARDFPHYGWERNMGYPTRDHLAALAQCGITPHHRQSYAPVRKILENNNNIAA